MKKSIILSALALFSLPLFAQLGGNNNLFPATGYAGIGTKTPTEALDIKSGSIRLGQYTGTENRVLMIDPTGKIVPGMAVAVANPLPGGVQAPGTGQPNKDVAPFWSLSGNTVPATYLSTTSGTVNRSIATISIDQAIDVPFKVAGYEVMRMTNDGTLKLIGYTNSTGGFKASSLGIGTDVSGLEKLKVDGNSIFSGDVSVGRLSIGGATFGPTSKLAVDGVISARDIQVLTGAHPDYVFNKDYALLSLKDLEAYIEANHHLPGIPSACEVEENKGVQLGEMNRLLLEKVEELSLHAIEQHKQLEQLRAEVVQLKKLAEDK